MFGDRVPDYSVQGLKVAKLICVTADNHNKYYCMFEQADDTFKVAYGRVQGSVTEETFPMSRWNEKYKNKTSARKGYKDVTHLYMEIDVPAPTQAKSITEKLDMADPVVMNLINTLQGYANKSITTNYTVTSEKVTQLMIDAAQNIIDELVPLIVKGLDIDKFNKKLLELYQIIPRRMKQVRDHLISAAIKLEDIQKLIHEEQTTLDVMAGQVQMNASNKKVVDTGEKNKNILDILGIDVTNTSPKEFDKVKSMMGEKKDLLHKLYGVVNHKTQKQFDSTVKSAKDKTSDLLFHGSRNQNWLNILQTGLLIRPAGAIHTGSMFGDACYFADKAKKSIGYSSHHGYWTGERSDRGYIALYDVHLGKSMIIERHKSEYKYLNYDKISKDGYDSVYAKGGYDLINNEFMVYRPAQCTIKYLLEIK